MDFAGIGAGGASGVRSRAGKSGRREKHSLAYDGSGGAHRHAVLIVGAAIQKGATAANTGKGIVQGWTLEDRVVVSWATVEHACKLIGDLDLETSQRGRQVIAEGWKLLAASGNSRKRHHNYHDCKQTLHGRASCADPDGCVSGTLKIGFLLVHLATSGVYWLEM